MSSVGDFLKMPNGNESLQHLSNVKDNQIQTEKKSHAYKKHQRFSKYSLASAQLPSH